MIGRPGETIKEAAARQQAAYLEEKKNEQMIAWLTEGIKGRTMDLYDIRITTDPDYPDKVEIEMLENGVGVEGGQFDIAGLILAIKKFYAENY
jgi:hypothetical protein